MRFQVPETDDMAAEIRELGVQIEVAIRDYVDSIWAVVEEELVGYPEVSDRIRRRLQSKQWRRTQSERGRG